MSPSSMFSRGSRSPFVFWPSKISRSLQNHVTVLSCRKKYFVFQNHKLYFWFGLIAIILLTKVQPLLPPDSLASSGRPAWTWSWSLSGQTWIFQHFSTFISTIIVPITWRPRKRSCWWSQAELLLCIPLPLLPTARTSKMINYTESKD